VSERVLPRTVVVSLRDGDKPDQQRADADLRQHLPTAGRAQASVFLTVLAGTYDPHKRLLPGDARCHTKVEVLRLPMRVDLAFGNDF
jgi:hypothetical protein